jgi:hypothetical protein
MRWGGFCRWPHKAEVLSLTGNLALGRRDGSARRGPAGAGQACRLK